MTHEFEIKEGDTSPILSTVLLDGDGVPLDLTSASSVGFTMVLAKHPRTVVVFMGSAGFAPDTTGAVTWAWVAGNTDVPGKYDIEWTVIGPGGFVATVPSCGFDTVRVNPRAA